MDYTQALERIHSLNKFGSRPGLDRIRMLLKLMGNPQDKLQFVHVAGTNGKGSVCAMISSVLKASGYRTGLFISPYITDFCERIQIDNEPIPHGELAQAAEYTFAFVDRLNAQGVIITEFEFVMAVAFEYFLRKKCEVVVLEVGLGGSLDSTNVIEPPLCAVITRIGLDHTDILGSSVEAIAQQKCGIIKGGTRVVSSPQPKGAREEVASTCERLGVPLRFSEELPLQVEATSLRGTQLSWKGTEICLKLRGMHQVENCRTALCALEELSAALKNINTESIRTGIESAVNPARFELIAEYPPVVIDGAHNPDGMRTFSQSVREYLGAEKGVLLIGMLADKDSRSSLEYIKGMFSHVYTVPVNNPRAMTSQQMAELAKGYFESVTACESAEYAFEKAYAEARDRGVHLCVCGSLYLAGEIRPIALRLTEK